MRDTTPVPGVDRVRVPGDIEAENIADRRNNGIPLYPDVIENLRSSAKRLEIDLLIPDRTPNLRHAGPTIRR
jgi:LDH2 family malate/lactate/ureidoglycolate dehydrogenase